VGALVSVGGSSPAPQAAKNSFNANAPAPVATKRKNSLRDMGFFMAIPFRFIDYVLRAVILTSKTRFFNRLQKAHLSR
jgi:hypothetical protein